MCIYFMGEGGKRTVIPLCCTLYVFLWIGYLPVSYTSYKRDKLCHIHVLDNSPNKSPLKLKPATICINEIIFNFYD